MPNPRTLTRVRPIVLRNALTSLASFVLISVPFLLSNSSPKEKLPTVEINDQVQVLEGGQDGLFWIPHAPSAGRVSINIPDSNWIIFVTRNCPNLGMNSASTRDIPMPAEDALSGRKYDATTSPLKNARLNLSFEIEGQNLDCPEGANSEHATTAIFLSKSRTVNSTLVLKSDERVEVDGEYAWIWSTTTKLSATILLRPSPLQFLLEVEPPPCSPTSAVPRLSFDTANEPDSSFTSDAPLVLERTLALRQIRIELELAETSACTLEGDGRRVYFLFRARPIGEFEQLEGVLHSSST